VQLKKNKRLFTIMVIPHTEESIISIRIPLYLLQILSVILLIGLMLSFVWIKSYRVLKGDVEEIFHLREENRALIGQLDVLAQETEDLRKKVEQIDNLSREICTLIELPPPEEKNEPPILLAFHENVRALPSRGNNQVFDKAVLNVSHLREVIPEKNQELLQLKESIEEYRKQMAATPSIWPAGGKVTSEFGPRRSPLSRRKEFHFGIDIAGPRGTPILATAEGEVVFASYRIGFGNTIIIDHGYGITTVYAHLKNFNVHLGSSVQKGQVIGYMGSTGYSTGVHLHYEVHRKGVAVNPRAYLP
jgi:hypothetical protein